MREAKTYRGARRDAIRRGEYAEFAYSCDTPIYRKQWATGKYTPAEEDRKHFGRLPKDPKFRILS